jgi:hypothetical protein
MVVIGGVRALDRGAAVVARELGILPVDVVLDGSLRWFRVATGAWCAEDVAFAIDVVERIAAGPSVLWQRLIHRETESGAETA